MPEILQRKLSPGEVDQANRKKFFKKPKNRPVLTKKQLRKVNHKKKAQIRAEIQNWHGSNELIASTARAWGLSYKDTRDLFNWIDWKIAPQYRSVVLAKLLRRKYKPTPSKGV